MPGMRLGGIDPSILRELSGVYKPFVKAFKELVSNAFDADADAVSVRFSDDFSTVSIEDDGVGLNAIEFKTDFARIGGGSRRWAGDRTRKGRLRIGSKGIGFLALARYCNLLKIESGAERAYEADLVLADGCFDLQEHLGVPIPLELLIPRLKFDIRRGRKLEEHRDYTWNKSRTHLTLRNADPAKLKLKLDCKGLIFNACLDFEKLLQLADNADLEKLDDFATIEVLEGKQKGTRITAENLKPFVRRELRAERRKGFVRNISSRTGLEQFNWQLSRCTPLAYCASERNLELGKQLTSTQGTLCSLNVTHGDKTIPLFRPALPFEPDCPDVLPEMVLNVDIKEGGLKATGFVAGFESVIFPAEYRGLSIRVRGVSIGDPGFLGAETLLTGAMKAALSQITGEIIVLSGLDAVDTLNPGRESFYEESEQYKILRKHLVGEGERIGGYLNKAINNVLRRSALNSKLADVISKANTRRRALDDVSGAVSDVIAKGDPRKAELLREMVKSTHSHLNGLANAKPAELGLPLRIGNLTVVREKGQKQPAVIDYANEQVVIDVSRREWSWSMLLFNRHFEVIHRMGAAEQPIAEIDMKADRIFVNWGHPVRMHMDERGFLRTALAWAVARQAAGNEPDQMMDLALRLLSFSIQTDV